MKKLFLISALMGCLMGSAQAQKVCAANDYLEKNLREDPAAANLYRQLEEYIGSYVRNYPFNPQLHRSSITIPVVVHIVYKNAAENISDAQVNAQMDILNRDYRMRNATEIAGVPNVFRPSASDCLIQFALAKRDTNNLATTGIKRYPTTQPRFLYTTDNVKTAAPAWDTHRYLNVWVCDIFDDSPAPDGSGDGLMGYGTFPEMTEIQGVVMDYMWFGTQGSPRNQGRTLTHEMGHFFDLNHIWGDASCGDDHVTDTPTQQASNSGCPTHPQITCANTTGDMFMNYMDYTADNCMVMFTAGQRARMLATLSPGGPRASLATSNALIPPNASGVTWTDVFLQPQTSDYPSWKASLGMIRGWALQQSENYNELIAAVSSDSRRFGVIPTRDVSEAIYALHLNRGTQEMLACYTPSGFLEFVRQGPIALLSTSPTESYGLVIKGMQVDATTGRAILQILDPMSVGPRGFFMLDSRGSEYNVDYSEFMTEMLEQAVMAGKHIYIVRAERRTGS